MFGWERAGTSGNLLGAKASGSCSHLSLLWGLCIPEGSEGQAGVSASGARE